MGQEAEKYANQGYQCLKVKIGFGVQRDVASVRAVREAVGEQIAIRVDAEECYDLKTSVKLARYLDEFNIELLSQPISRTNYHDMAVLRTIIDIPLLLDESIETPEDVLLATRLQTGDLVNIKVLKCGGMLNSKRMAAIAQAAGKECLTGSMLEMGPGTVFSAHFAISTANVTYTNELVGTVLLADDMLTEPVMVEDGALRLTDKPGLGIELDPGKMKRYSTW
jgi:L-alanine-DL-glutamate epimerase-like enolase superfamily enzyme